MTSTLRRVYNHLSRPQREAEWLDLIKAQIISGIHDNPDDIYRRAMADISSEIIERVRVAPTPRSREECLALLDRVSREVIADVFAAAASMQRERLAETPNDPR